MLIVILVARTHKAEEGYIHRFFSMHSAFVHRHGALTWRTWGHWGETATDTNSRCGEVGDRAGTAPVIECAVSLAATALTVCHCTTAVHCPLRTCLPCHPTNLPIYSYHGDTSRRPIQRRSYRYKAQDPSSLRVHEDSCDIGAGEFPLSFAVLHRLNLLSPRWIPTSRLQSLFPPFPVSSYRPVGSQSSPPSCTMAGEFHATFCWHTLGCTRSDASGVVLSANTRGWILLCSQSTRSAMPGCRAPT